MASAQQQQGTGYTNLQSYLTANQGNQLGQTLSNDIQGVTNNAEGQLNQQVGDFNTNLASASSSINNAYGAANTNVNTLNSNPTAFNANDMSQVQGFQGQAYAGPTGLSNTGDLNAQAQNISGLAGLAGSQAGRGQLLRTFVGSPNYTNTAQSLDSAFLGNGVDNQLRGTTQQANRYSDQVNQQEQAAQFKAGATQSGLANDQSNVTGNINNIGNNLTNVLNSRVTNANNQDTSFNNALSTDNLNQLANLGYNVPGTAASNLNTAQYYGIGSQYFNPLTQGSTGGSNANMAGVANTNDRAQATALAQLTNNAAYNNYTTGPSYIAPTLQINQTAANPVLQNEYKTLQNVGLGSLASQYGPTSPYGALENLLTFSGQNSALAPTGYGVPTANATLGNIINSSVNTLAASQGGVGASLGSYNQASSDVSALQSFLANQFANDGSTQGSTSTGNNNPTGFTQTTSPTATAPTTLPSNFNPNASQIYTDPSTGTNWVYNGSTQTWTQKGS